MAPDALQPEFYARSAVEPDGDAGVSVRAVFLDEAGREHHAVTYTTVGAKAMLARRHTLRESMELYYHSLGCELISLQLEIPDRRVVSDRRLEPRGPGRRTSDSTGNLLDLPRQMARVATLHQGVEVLLQKFGPKDTDTGTNGK